MNPSCPNDERRRYNLNINTTASCTGNLPLRNLPRCCPSFSCVSSSPMAQRVQTRPGKRGRCWRTGGPCSYTQRDTHQSSTEAEARSLPLSVTAPALLQRYFHSLVPGGESNMTSGPKAGVWQHTTAEQGQALWSVNVERCPAQMNTAGPQGRAPALDIKRFSALVNNSCARVVLQSDMSRSGRQGPSVRRRP